MSSGGGFLRKKISSGKPGSEGGSSRRQRSRNKARGHTQKSSPIPGPSSSSSLRWGNGGSLARSDCQRYGWVLDGFPETRAEAAALVASDLAPGIVLCLEGLSNVDIMSRQRASYSHMMDSALTSSTSPSQDVHSSAVLGRLQRWKRSSESTKATLSQAYLNIHHITAGNQGSSGDKDNQRAARSKWQVLASARDALAKNVSQRSAHASAIAQHVPCLLYTSPSPRDQRGSRMPSSA